jgi:hypothetical protein
VSELTRIQQELKAPKNQLNKFGNYKYRSCEDILEAVKPLLRDCILNISDEIIVMGMGDKQRFYVKATVYFKDGDFETISTAYARESENKKGMDESQITGAASSYARKSALNGLFLIDDTKDADTMDNSGKQEEAREKLRIDLINDIKESYNNLCKRGEKFTESQKNKMSKVDKLNLDELRNISTKLINLENVK